jgi:glycosyltransferase involved in cell wall biosynthesis
MRYKAATKLVQYLSAAIPAVASPIGVNAEILAGNRVGFAASNTHEWLESLQTLIRDAALRTQMGQTGRQLVVERYSIEANAPILAEVLCGRSPDA